MARKLFGTDGIRGVANTYPMDSETALKVGKAVASVFREMNGKPGRHKIVIGKDTRLSGYMIETALTSGIVSMGVDVLLVGPMPTPAIAHLTKSLDADAGIVLSASHNPAEDNGIKVFNNKGFKLDDELEGKIEELVVSGVRDNSNFTGDRIGKAFRVDDAKGRYIEYAKHAIKSENLEGLKVVLDCANGAAYNVAPNIFLELGAEVIILNANPDGMNINKDCGALHPEQMQKRVRENKADIGIALDGDADRVIVCDERGKDVDGDHIMAILALDLKERDRMKTNRIVATVMSNIGLDKAMEKAGIAVVRAKVGDRYVIEEMLKGKDSLGGEQSGHIIYMNYSTTGDGIISALQLLRIMKRKGKKLSELAKCMEAFPQKLVNVEVREKKPIVEMAGVKAKIEEAEKELEGKGRVLVRYSGTQNLCRVMVEAPTEGEVEKCCEEIVKEIKKEIGA